MHLLVMFQNLPPLKSLLAFESAARNLSFTEAANELSLTQGAISYQVKQLEQSLGIKLFHRKVRQVELSAEGQRLYKTTHQLLQTLKDEIQIIAPNNNKDKQILTISVSTFFATRWLSKRLGQFLNLNPEITIRLQHSVNDPEFKVGDVDMGIRWGNGQFPDCHAKQLLSLPIKAYCSPELVRGEMAINKLSDLRKHTFLHDQMNNDYWKEWLTKAGLTDITKLKGPIIVDPNVRIQSAIDGQGILLANPMLQDELDRGELVELFGDIQLDELGYYLIYTEDNYQSRSLKLFTDWLLSQVEKV